MSQSTTAQLAENSTHEILNNINNTKHLESFNTLQVLFNTNKSSCDFIPSISSWLIDNYQLSVSLNNIDIDIENNTYMHYKNTLAGTLDAGLDMFNLSSGKLNLFGITDQDIRIERYKQHELSKYESIITNTDVNNESNIFIFSRKNPIVHIHIPDKSTIINESFVEYRFNLMEFGSSPAYIFVREMTLHTHKRFVIGIEFTINEIDKINSLRLNMIEKYITDLNVIVNC